MDERGSSDEAAVASARERSGRRRRVLSGVALVLACLSILLTTVAVWTHQVAFNTERFTALTSSVVTSPEIIDPLSTRISTQVVDALDVQSRIAARLPDAVKPLAGALTLAVRDAIDKRLQVALANPKIQQALVATLSFTHARIMALLRDQSDAVTVVDGYVVIQVFPVVGAALQQLQEIGLIPPEVQLPDLSSGEAPEVLLPRLQAALGITLPADFGTIQLMPADKLLTARTYVRAFDLIVVVLVILSVVLVALAIWLARQRRRMVIYLGIGTIIAFLLARLAIHSVEDSLIAGIADAGVAAGVRSVVDATIDDLRRVTSIVLVATAIVAIAAYLWGRPKWAVAVASGAGDLAGRAGTTAATAGSAGIGAAAERRPTRAAVEETVRTNRVPIERAGLAIIVFIVAWLAIGLEFALLGAALVLGWELIVRALASPAADGSAPVEPDGGPTAADPAPVGPDGGPSAGA
jgi:hypothetical protein